MDVWICNMFKFSSKLDHKKALGKLFTSLAVMT